MDRGGLPARPAPPRRAPTRYARGVFLDHGPCRDTPRPNDRFEKRQRELAKAKKQHEKRQSKLARRAQAPAAIEPPEAPPRD